MNVNVPESQTTAATAHRPGPVVPLGPSPARWSRGCAIGTAAAGALLTAGALLAAAGVINPDQFFHSYLFGYTLALDVTLGALFWVLIHHVADAGWSVGLRRIAEQMTRALPVLAALFLPILWGIYSGHLHDWYTFLANPQPTDHHLGHLWEVRSIHFHPAFFLARIALYFTVWVFYAERMRRWSEQSDAGHSPGLGRAMRWWAPSGLLLLGLTSTFFAFDLLMSLQYSWFSTIYGVYFWAGAIRGSLATILLAALAMRAAGGIGAQTVTVEHLHDVGKLMFGFTIFWAYIAFSQYFLIWYSNMPEETQFYLLRRNGAWYTLSILLGVLNFGVPFFLLLPRANKRNPTLLAAVAVWIVAMHALDLYWQILPVLHHETIALHWLDLVAPIALYGLVVTIMFRGLRRVPWIPLGDDRLNETLGYHNETP